MERLQKYLSECGVCSRRKAEELILQGKITVNGNVVTQLGTKVSGGEVIEVDGQIVKKENNVYYLLYKPTNVVCTTSDEKSRKIVTELIDTDKKIYPIGRLDYDTTGLLLLTNDGELSNKLTHPSGNIPKVYSAKITGILTKEEIMKLKEGVIIDGTKTKPCTIKVKKIDKENNKSYVNITLTEGRNHEVKKLFLQFSHKVVKLKRIKYAFLTLEGLKIGEYRKLTVKEVKKLYAECI